MARAKRYLDINVLEAARQRVAHIFDTHDAVAVCFSGGKDSLVVLHLALEEAKRRGRDKLDVVFRDEELIPDPVIEFVESYRVRPDIAMRWFAVPMMSQKYILGRSFAYIQWDNDRAHIRPKPAHAITEMPPGVTVVDQYTADTWIASFFKGKVALLTGIRAAESIMRFRASVNKLNENYINRCNDGRTSLCKPIYDWEEADVFRFFFDHQIRYCSLYDAQVVAGSGLRVSTPLHAESAKRIGMPRAIAPMFYDQVLRLFPEMAVQERYYGDLDRDALKAKYGESIDGIRAYIFESITDEDQQAKALKRLDGIARRQAKDPGAYPLHHILKYFMGGSFKRELLPARKAT